MGDFWIGSRSQIHSLYKMVAECADMTWISFFLYERIVQETQDARQLFHRSIVTKLFCQNRPVAVLCPGFWHHRSYYYSYAESIFSRFFMGKKGGGGGSLFMSRIRRFSNNRSCKRPFPTTPQFFVITSFPIFCSSALKKLWDLFP